MVGIAFRGRAKTWLVGEPTADGYTTNNSWYQLRDNFVLNLATFFVADRKGKVYRTTVDPDQTVIAEDNFDNLSKDEKVKAAMVWLNRNNSR